MDLFSKPRTTPKTKYLNFSFLQSDGLKSTPPNDSKIPLNSNEKVLHEPKGDTSKADRVASSVEKVSNVFSASFNSGQSLLPRKRARVNDLVTPHSKKAVEHEPCGSVTSSSPLPHSLNGSIFPKNSFGSNGRHTSSPGRSLFSFEETASNVTATKSGADNELKRQIHSLKADLAKANTTAALEAQKLHGTVHMLEEQVASLRQKTAQLESERGSLLRKADKVQQSAQQTMHMEKQLHDESRKAQQEMALKLKQTVESAARYKEELAKFQALTVTVIPFAPVTFPPDANLQEKLTIACQHWITALKDGRKPSEPNPLASGPTHDEINKQAEYVKQLEKQLARYKVGLAIARSKSVNAELLAAENTSLRAALDSLKRKQNAFAAANAQLELCKAKLELSQDANELVKLLRDSERELESKLAHERETVQSLERKLLAEREVSAELQKKCEISIKLRANAERLRNLSREEAEIYRNQLDSVQQAPELGLGALVESLKGLVANQEQEIKELCKENESLPPAKPQVLTVTSSEAADGEYAKKLISKLTQEKEILERQCSSMDRQLAAVECFLGSGGYNEQHVKINQHQTNPASLYFNARQNTLDLLQSENTELLNVLEQVQRVDKLETADTLVPAASLRRLEDTAESLRQQLSEKEKRLERLKCVFKDKTIEYREIVYALFGFRIDIRQDGKVRLSSMQALPKTTGGEAPLQFDFCVSKPADDVSDWSSASMQSVTDLSLVQIGGETGSVFVKRNVEQYISNLKSIPGFLSSVTLALLQ